MSGRGLFGVFVFVGVIGFVAVAQGGSLVDVIVGVAIGAVAAYLVFNLTGGGGDGRGEGTD